MPLVTRTSLQGNFFQEDTEPPNWNDADLWADTNASPRALFINNDGTALALGTIALDEIGDTITNHAGTGALSLASTLSNPGTSYMTRSSVTVDVDTANSGVALMGWCNYGTVAVRTMFSRIQESSSDVVAETSSSSTGGRIRTQTSRGLLTGVTSGNHTYDFECHLSTSDATDLLTNTGIIAIVIG